MSGRAYSLYLLGCLLLGLVLTGVLIDRQAASDLTAQEREQMAVWQQRVQASAADAAALAALRLESAALQTLSEAQAVQLQALQSLCEQNSALQMAVQTAEENMDRMRHTNEALRTDALQEIMRRWAQ